VSFPQAFAIVVPALLANAHAILMETAICGFVAVPELMYVTRDEIGMYYKTYEAFSILTVSYLILLLPLSLAAGHWERRLRNAQYSS
jgi:polar amino acid transport system permease protein